MTDNRQFWIWNASAPSVPDFLLRHGADAFERKFGKRPTLALLHPWFMARITNPPDGLRMDTHPSVQRRDVWFLKERE